MVIEAKEQGCKSFILPGENEPEGRLVKGIEILPADNLEELCAYLNGAARSEKSKREKKENEKTDNIEPEKILRISADRKR